MPLEMFQLLPGRRAKSRGTRESRVTSVDLIQGSHSTSPPCVALKVLLGGHPPSTVGSR
jgi:hypothetical protein